LNASATPAVMGWTVEEPETLMLPVRPLAGVLGAPVSPPAGLLAAGVVAAGAVVAASVGAALIAAGVVAAAAVVAAAVADGALVTLGVPPAPADGAVAPGPCPHAANARAVTRPSAAVRVRSRSINRFPPCADARSVARRLSCF
jgi:hypothetical protein